VLDGIQVSFGRTALKVRFALNLMTPQEQLYALRDEVKDYLAGKYDRDTGLVKGKIAEGNILDFRKLNPDYSDAVTEQLLKQVNDRRTEYKALGPADRLK
jgi:hypothetical protein